MADDFFNKPTNPDAPVNEPTPTDMDIGDKLPTDDMSQHELLVQMSKNIVEVMKTVAKISRNVEDFRQAWSKDQKAGRFVFILGGSAWILSLVQSVVA